MTHRSTRQPRLLLQARLLQAWTLVWTGCAAADVAVPPAPAHPAAFDPQRWEVRADGAAVGSRPPARGVPDWPTGLAPVASPAIAARSREPVPVTAGRSAHGR